MSRKFNSLKYHLPLAAAEYSTVFLFCFDSLLLSCEFVWATFPIPENLPI